MQASYRYVHNKGVKMQKFACKNIGLNCDYVAMSATKEETVKKAMEHGMKAHADLMKNMTADQSKQFAKRLEDSIQAV
jgi:predicted small metal-binding protein